MYRNEDRIAREEFPRDEMLLDVCLEEVLSGQTPPDLTARILSAMENSPGAEVVPPPVTPPPVSTPAQPVAAPRVARQRSARTTRTANTPQWAGMAIAAGVLAAGIGIVIIALQFSGGGDSPNVAVENVAQPTDVAPRDVPRDNQIARNQREQPTASPFRENLFGAKFPPMPEEAAVPWSLPYAVERQADDEVVQFVNAQVDGQPAGTKMDDDAWCRRVFQQLLGRSPSSDELVDFATSKSGAKREQLVDRLLTGEKYRDEYAAHWAGVWSDELLGPAAVVAENELANREGLQKYLQDSFAQSKPQDELTTELISATGSNRPGTPKFNGATNFVLAGADDNKASLAATVGRVFLGHQGQCAQCHDDNPGDGLSQQQFWQLAAFFQQAQPVKDEKTGAMQLVNKDFVGPTGDVDEAELLYKTNDKHRKIAYPVFVDGTPISADGRVEVVDRRQELAKLIVRSEDFSAATVQRYWEQLLGEQPGRNADALTRKRLVQGLAEQFAAHDFDQRKLMRWIVLSEANLPHELDENRSPRPLYENVAMALHDVSRQGRPIAASDRVLYARISASPKPGVSSPAVLDSEPEPRPIRKTAANEFVQRMTASDMATGDKIEHLFLHTLARRPTRGELAAAQRLLSSHDGNVGAALDDLWWAITKSAEYKSR